MYQYEQYFRRHIYERGFSIVESGAIIDFHISASGIEADVEGTEVYQVEVHLNDDEIQEMSCTCPYAMSGENCKHMAAVLIYAEMGDPEDDTDEDLILEALNRASKDDLLSFLKEHLADNEQLFRAFSIRFMPSAINVNDMVSKFRMLITIHMDGSDYIDYRQVQGLFNEIEEYVVLLRDMVNQGLYLEAAQIIAGATRGFDSIPLDDSDGWTSYFYDDLERLMSLIVQSGDQEAVGFAFQWMSELIESGDDWYLAERMYDLWTTGFTDDMHIEKLIEILKLRIERNFCSTENLENVLLDSNDLIAYANLLIARGDPLEGVVSMMGNYKSDYEVIKWLIVKAQEMEADQFELQLIQEGLDQVNNRGLYGAIIDFERMLCEYYIRMGNEEEYLATLRGLVFKSRWDLKWWIEYKDNFGGNWEEERDSLLTEFRSKGLDMLLYDIYALEHMWDSLMNLIEENKEVNKLEEYYYDLSELYSDRMIDLLARHLEQMMKHAGSRGKYRQAIHWLKRIGDLPSGKAVMENMIIDYRIKFSKRPALMDEMSRAGL